MVQDKRVDMGSMGDFNGVVGKNPGPRHQSHKDSAMDRSPYYDKVCTTACLFIAVGGNVAMSVWNLLCSARYLHLSPLIYR